MHIREAILDDTESISRLVYELSEKYIAPEFTSAGATSLLNSMKPDAIRKYLQAGFWYHVVEIKGQVVGVVGVRDNRHLYHLFIADEYQNQGIARKLWQVAFEACLSRGNPGIFTVNSSKYAVPMYEKLGFVPQSEPVESNGIVSIPMKWVVNR
jgi:GNAT superfamily N-acetyltransferase